MIKISDAPSLSKRSTTNRTPRLRLDGSARRENIIAAARSLFAERGFDGATTRELAERADVSEALIFKHFKSKRAIYQAMLEECLNSDSWAHGQKLLELKPSTATLAAMLHFIVERVTDQDDYMRSSHRLLTRSLGEDGEFARVVFQHVSETWLERMNACLRVAKRTGELTKNVSTPGVNAWFAQHIMMMLGFTHSPAKHVVEYGASRSTLIRETVAFCLRGMGLTEAAIERAYTPDTYALFAADAN